MVSCRGMFCGAPPKPSGGNELSRLRGSERSAAWADDVGATCGRPLARVSTNPWGATTSARHSPAGVPPGGAPARRAHRFCCQKRWENHQGLRAAVGAMPLKKHGDSGGLEMLRPTGYLRADPGRSFEYNFAPHLSLSCKNSRHARSEPPRVSCPGRTFFSVGVQYILDRRIKKDEG